MTNISGLISPEGILSYIRGMISDSLEGASNEDKVQITTHGLGVNNRPLNELFGDIAR
jgi:hypothetical protein